MAEKKNVLMLLSNPFRPDPRVHKEAKALVNAGYHVTIICWDREGKYALKENTDGIDLIRVGPRSAFSEPLKFLTTVPMFWLQAYSLSKKLDWDIIHCHDLDTLPVGILISRKKLKPLVYDSHEIYSSMVEEVAPGVPFKLARTIERWLVKKPSAVICVNDRFKEILDSWGARKTEVVMGCPPKLEALVNEVENVRRKISPDGKPVVLYIGVLEKHRSVLELVSGFASGKCPGAKLVTGGFGSLEKSITETSNENFLFLGAVKSSDLPKYTLASDILVAVYDPAFGNNRDSVPNKLFEAMGAGKPIIVANGTWTGQTVVRLKCGLTVKYGDDEIFSAIKNLITNRELYKTCAENGLKAFEKEYNWPNMEKRLLRLYDDLAASEN